MKLRGYLGGLIATRIVGSLAILVGILQILDLLDITTDIVERGLGGAGVAYYALLRMPRLIEQAAPLAVLVGSLFGFAKLASESAVTALRSAGVSSYRITIIAMPVAVAVAIIQLTLGAWVAPRTDQALTDWWRASTPPAEAAETTDPISVRIGSEVLVATPDADGRLLRAVTIYRRNEDGRLIQRIQADTAVWETDHWRLTSPHFETLGTESIRSGGAREMDWTVKLEPQGVRTLMEGPSVITPSDARSALEGGVSVRPRSYYATQIQRTWAGPVACLVMLLLAAPVSLANFRSGGGPLMVACLGAGLLFLVFDGTFTALGESGAAPAILAAWAAPAMFAILGVTTLIYLEG